MKRLPGIALLLVATALGGSWTARAASVESRLDRRTGTTLQITAKPWVLALDQPQLAAHARDYVTLYGLQVSNGIERRLYVAAFYWSTVPGRNRHAGANPGLQLLLDDRELTLAPVADTLRSAGVSQWPLKAPGRDAMLVLYPAGPDLLRQLGHATRVLVRPQDASGAPPEIWFEPWRSGRAAFDRFAAEVLGLR